MIKLTVQEKAERYDALQTAIKYTMKDFKRRKNEGLKNYEAYGALNIGAYNLGMAQAYGNAVEALERWHDR